MSSFVSLSAKRASDVIDTVRDVYEGFVIYSFFTLLINFLGGERQLLELLSQRVWISHPWPMSMCLQPLNVR
jgi:hypothetical protein